MELKATVILTPDVSSETIITDVVVLPGEESRITTVEQVDTLQSSPPLLDPALLLPWTNCGDARMLDPLGAVRHDDAAAPDTAFLRALPISYGESALAFLSAVLSIRR